MLRNNVCFEKMFSRTHIFDRPKNFILQAHGSALLYIHTAYFILGTSVRTTHIHTQKKSPAGSRNYSRIRGPAAFSAYKSGVNWSSVLDVAAVCTALQSLSLSLSLARSFSYSRGIAARLRGTVSITCAYRDHLDATRARRAQHRFSVSRHRVAIPPTISKRSIPIFPRKKKIQ